MAFREPIKMPCGQVVCVKKVHTFLFMFCLLIWARLFCLLFMLSNTMKITEVKMAASPVPETQDTPSQPVI
jgi:hypothetical protein